MNKPTHKQLFSNTNVSVFTSCECSFSVTLHDSKVIPQDNKKGQRMIHLPATCNVFLSSHFSCLDIVPGDIPFTLLQQNLLMLLSCIRIKEGDFILQFSNKK